MRHVTAVTEGPWPPGQLARGRDAQLALFDHMIATERCSEQIRRKAEAQSHRDYREYQIRHVCRAASGDIRRRLFLFRPGEVVVGFDERRPG